MLDLDNAKAVFRCFVWGDGGSIPTGGALEVRPCDFGPKQFDSLAKKKKCEKCEICEKMWNMAG